MDLCWGLGVGVGSRMMFSTSRSFACARDRATLQLSGLFFLGNSGEVRLDNAKAIHSVFSGAALSRGASARTVHSSLTVHCSIPLSATQISQATLRDALCRAATFNIL